MRFPKSELEIDKYLKVIKDLLNDQECHLFIDTNIISQLYKLNDDARTDFFEWVTTVKDRFHIPNWVVHEYQKRYVGQKTRDYLTELDGDLVKRLSCFSNFAKGYISDSLLVGSAYQDKKAELFEDLNQVNERFGKVYAAITNKLSEHQLKVHSDILSNLQQFTMQSDIYSFLKELNGCGEIRYSHLVPPGYGDAAKAENQFGDIIIWKEILDYCKNESVTKAIWITRDSKPDMKYSPQRQTMEGHPVNNDDRIAIANEGLVYEFSLETGSEEFYLISFMSLVKCLVPVYQNLAFSFQIVTTPENGSQNNEKEDVKCVDVGNNNPLIEDQLEPIVEPRAPYSGSALADSEFETTGCDSQVKAMLEYFKSYNWYKQNDAVKSLRKWAHAATPTSQQRRDEMFVLGRNVYQSAVGSAFEAIDFLRYLKNMTNGWDLTDKQSLVDGMLYEVFFDSSGHIRPRGFKALMYSSLLKSIDELELDSPYDFIKEQLSLYSSDRFIPEVHSTKKYKVEFSFNKVDDGWGRTQLISINGQDVSSTFLGAPGFPFAEKSEISARLSAYYAIPEEDITVEGLDNGIIGVTFINEV